MEFLVRVRGTVDERDLWPYARFASREESGSVLLLTVHDSQELVGALASLTAVGLHLVSVQRRGSDLQTPGGKGAEVVRPRSKNQPQLNHDG